MDFELRDWVRPVLAVGHAPDEDDAWLGLKLAPQFFYRITLTRREIDMSVIGCVVGQVHLDIPPSCEQ
jgi:hypothetical protein